MSEEEKDIQIDITPIKDFLYNAKIRVYALFLILWVDILIVVGIPFLIYLLSAFICTFTTFPGDWRYFDLGYWNPLVRFAYFVIAGFATVIGCGIWRTVWGK